MALALPLSLAACGTAAAPAGPPVSPTGIVYPPGVPPSDTRLSQTAILYLRQDRVDRALELSLEGVREDPTNPIHYFLAGVAYARSEDYVHADSLFAEAQRIYPAYELQIEPQREAAWGQAFNAGLEAYEDGDTERTIELWRQAIRMFDLRPEAHRNLASLLTSEGRYADAIDVYEQAVAGLEKRPVTRALTDEEIQDRKQNELDIEQTLAQLYLLTNRFTEAEPLLRRQLARDSTNTQLRSDLATALSGEGREDEAAGIYAELLSEQDLASTQLFNLGVALFRASDFARAAAAFRRLTDRQPNSRDAWFNYANALFAGAAWDPLVVSGARLMEVDPLGENAGLITAKATLETGDRKGAVEILARVDALPSYVDQLQMRSPADGTSVTGRIEGNAARAGDTLVLRFFFYGDGGALLGSKTVTVTAPEKGKRVAFEVTFSQRAAAYRYELVPQDAR